MVKALVCNARIPGFDHRLINMHIEFFRYEGKSFRSSFSLPIGGSKGNVFFSGISNDSTSLLLSSESESDRGADKSHNSAVSSDNGSAYDYDHNSDEAGDSEASDEGV